jgi:DNA (cytosine-5)-methyltransferase 1
MLNAIELFAGAGGLGMGVSLAGFKTSTVIEFDRDACDTLRENQKRDNPLVRSWNIKEMDVRKYPFHLLQDRVSLIAGGPPCQPFSLGGKHKAQLDDRDMFPSLIKAVREVRPRAFIVENVKGLTRKTFANYFQYITLQLEYPELIKGKSETWTSHLKRLEEQKTCGNRDGLTYELVYRVVNAADYGIPQKRERIFMVGFRHDLHVAWSFPQETHSLDALLHSQFVSGEYWERHQVAQRDRTTPPTTMRRRLERLQAEPPKDCPWLTVRDALAGLPDPQKRNRSMFHNHTFQAGARVYKGHTGSPIDLPSKTLKAGVHGVPGGENMLVKPDGSVRYFTVREAARLQTFPDTYVFHGAWSETMRQLGNAVPVALGRTIASSVASTILEAEEKALRDQLNQNAGAVQ